MPAPLNVDREQVRMLNGSIGTQLPESPLIAKFDRMTNDQLLEAEAVHLAAFLAWLESLPFGRT